MPQIKNIQYSTAATGSTITATDTGDDLQLIHEDSVLTVALTISFPATPQDGQQFRFCSVNGVTGLTLTGGTIISALTTLAAGLGACFIYRKSNTKWYRIL